jgi:hypothetical protein
VPLVIKPSRLRIDDSYTRRVFRDSNRHAATPDLVSARQSAEHAVLVVAFKLPGEQL